MGTWLVPADLLARSRFVVSPLSETVAALTLLSEASALTMPWQRAFRTTHQEAYAELLADDRVLGALAGSLWRPRRGTVPGWMADFLSLPPLGGAATFADELDQLADWGDERMRAELRSLRARSPAARAGGHRPAGRGAGAADLGVDRHGRR